MPSLVVPLLLSTILCMSILTVWVPLSESDSMILKRRIKSIYYQANKRYFRPRGRQDQFYHSWTWCIKRPECWETSSSHGEGFFHLNGGDSAGMSGNTFNRLSQKASVHRKIENIERYHTYLVTAYHSEQVLLDIVDRAKQDLYLKEGKTTFRKSYPALHIFCGGLALVFPGSVTFESDLPSLSLWEELTLTEPVKIWSAVCLTVSATWCARVSAFVSTIVFVIKFFSTYCTLRVSNNERTINSKSIRF